MVQVETSRISQITAEFELHSGVQRAFGDEAFSVVESSLASRLQEGDLQGALLDLRELPQYQEAFQFMEERFRGFGVSLPLTAQIYDGSPLSFGLEKAVAAASGIERRIFFRDLEKLGQVDREGTLVHELTHAMSKVRVSLISEQLCSYLAENQKVSFNVGWQISRVNQYPIRLFCACTEYAAEANRREYLKGRGVSEVTQNDEITVDLTGADESFREPLFSIAEKVLNPNSFDRNGDALRVSIPCKFTCTDESHNKARHHGYSMLVHALDRLATEVFPELGEERAVETFRYLVAQADASGEMKPVLRFVKESLGTTAIRLLSEVRPELDRDSEQYFIAHLFAEAASLPSFERESVRRELTRFLG